MERKTEIGLTGWMEEAKGFEMTVNTKDRAEWRSGNASDVLRATYWVNEVKIFPRLLNILVHVCLLSVVCICHKWDLIVITELRTRPLVLWSLI